MPLWRSGFRGRVTLTVMVAGTSGLGLFVVSVHHAGAATAAVLYQMWTISAAALLAVRGGLLTPSAILFRKANLDTATLNVNAVFFAVPMAALGLLFLFGERIARPRTFAAGAAVILVVNVLLQAGSFKTQTAGPATETSVQR